MYRNCCMFKMPSKKLPQNSEFMKIYKISKPPSLIHLMLGKNR